MQEQLLLVWDGTVLGSIHLDSSYFLCVIFRLVLTLQHGPQTTKTFLTFSPKLDMKWGK